MRVKRTASFVMGFGGIMVKPGLNLFSDEDSERLKKDPAFKEQCGLGNQTVLSDGPDEEASLVDSILKMNVKNATKAVKDTLDIDVLEELSGREERTSVARTIRKQIEMLKAE
jgi:hypothetical protein